LIKLGFQILAVTFAKITPQHPQDLKLLQKARDFVYKHPIIIFASTDRGVNFDRVAISIHKDYADCYKFIQELKRDYEEFYTIIETFVVSLKSDKIIRQISLKGIAGCLEKEKMSEMDIFAVFA